MNFFPKAKQSDWYRNPQMAGHRWAKEAVDHANQVLNKWAKTHVQRKFARSVIVDSDSWHCWNLDQSKSYVNHVRYAVRRIEKALTVDGGVTALLSHYNAKSGVLKTNLTHALEILAYENDRDTYFESYHRTFGFYGLTREESLERFTQYHQTKMWRSMRTVKDEISA